MAGAYSSTRRTACIRTSPASPPRSTTGAGCRRTPVSSDNASSRAVDGHCRSSALAFATYPYPTRATKPSRPRRSLSSRGWSTTSSPTATGGTRRARRRLCGSRANPCRRPLQRAGLGPDRGNSPTGGPHWHGGPIPGPGGSRGDLLDDLLECRRRASRHGVSLQPVPVQRGDVAGARPLHPGGQPRAVSTRVPDTGPDADGEWILPIPRTGGGRRLSVVRHPSHFPKDSRDANKNESHPPAEDRRHALRRRSTGDDPMSREAGGEQLRRPMGTRPGARHGRDRGLGSVDPRLPVWRTTSFPKFGIPDLGKVAEDAGLEWHCLPIRDVDVPDERFERLWTYSGHILRRKLASGERIVLHCRGGLGRTGTIGTRLLIECGVAPEEALRRVRAARCEARSRPPTRKSYVLRQRAVAPDDWYYADRVLACLLGGAVGDALGFEVEFQSLSDIRERFGPEGIQQPALNPRWENGRQRRHADDALHGRGTDREHRAGTARRHTARWARRGPCRDARLVRDADRQGCGWPAGRIRCPARRTGTGYDMHGRLFGRRDGNV